jgi:competence protein ComEC
MKHVKFLIAICLSLLAGSQLRAGAKDGKLDAYFIDVEGGASVLWVTPAGESLLIDTGNPGGNNNDRDPGRIAAAAKLAGISKIDYLIITHYHIDHFGGAVDLSKLIPIGTLYDNGDENPSRDRPTPEYLALKADKKIMIKPGDVIPLKQSDKPGAPKLEIKCIVARKKFIDPPANGKPNPFESESKGKPLDLSDNANSIVTLFSFGDWRFLDAGDLTWNIEHDVASPVHRVGTTLDVFKVTHHGLAQSNNPVFVKPLEPTVAIMTNGTTKGCEPETFATLKATPSIQTIWQIHTNLRADGNVNNTAPEFIANLQAACDGNHIEMHVGSDSRSYTVGIPATKVEKTYQTKKRE